MGLNDLKKKIEKASKGTHVSVLSQSDIAKSVDTIETPSYDLNRILSGNLFKGLPLKSLSLMIGPESSGKSSMAALCVAEAQRKGYSPIILDTEGAWSHEFCQRWGLDIDNALYIYEPFVENINVILGQIIDEGEKDYVLILDSLGSLETKKLLNDAVDGEVKDDQGSLQRRIKRMLKLILAICKRQNTLGIFTGHYYGNPSQYGSPEQVGGGKFAKLAPDIIVAFKNTKIMSEGAKKDQKVIGNRISAITLKNRFYPPFNEGAVEIDYQNGINRLAGMVDLAMQSGYIERNGAWYSNLETGEKFQGSHNAIKCIDNNLLEKMNEWLKKTGYSTINENIKEAEDLMEEAEEAEEKEEMVEDEDQENINNDVDEFNDEENIE